MKKSSNSNALIPSNTSTNNRNIKNEQCSNCRSNNGSKTSFYYERMLDEDELKSMLHVSSHALYGSLLETKESSDLSTKPFCHQSLGQNHTTRISNYLHSADMPTEESSHTYRKRKEKASFSKLSKRRGTEEIVKNQGLVQRWHLYRKVVTRHNNNIYSVSMTGGSNDNNNICPEVAVVDLKVGNKLNGHEGIVHGGIVALFFDEAMGCGYNVVMKQNSVNPQAGFTAMLQTNFRSPMLQNKSYIIRVYHNKEKSAGKRKIYITAVLSNYDESVTYADAEALFITSPKSKL